MLSSTDLINIGLINMYFLIYNADLTGTGIKCTNLYVIVIYPYDASKEDYLRPSEHIGLDWIALVFPGVISRRYLLQKSNCAMRCEIRYLLVTAHPAG